MSNSWDEMRKAKEEIYFQKQNELALQKIREKGLQKPRLSPISGKPMKQVPLMGVIIDHCEESGGVWLDKGELLQLIKVSHTMDKAAFDDLFGGLI